MEPGREEPDTISGLQKKRIRKDPAKLSLARVAESPCGTHSLAGNLAVPPQYKRLATRRDPFDFQPLNGRLELLALLDHQCSHLLAARADLVCRLDIGGQAFPKSLQFPERTRHRRLIKSRPEGGQVGGAQPSLAGNVFERNFWLTQCLSIFVRPSGQKIGGIIHLVPFIKRDDPLNTILVSIGFGHGRIRSEQEAVGSENEVIGHLTTGRQVLLDQCRGNGE